MARQAASMMSGMSDEQLASMLAQSGMPGITPAMAKQAANMMRSMPPEQLAAMAQAQAGFGGGMPPSGSGSCVAATAAPTAAPAAAAAPAVSPAGASQEEQMRAAAEAMKQNPEMMKSAAAMLENMSEEQLRGMAAAMPGAAGMQVGGQPRREGHRGRRGLVTQFWRGSCTGPSACDGSWKVTLRAANPCMAVCAARHRSLTPPR